MKKTSLFLLLFLPFAIFAQKADQCLCTEEDFYDDNFLDLFKDKKDEVVALPDAQNTSYFEVNAYSYQQLTSDISIVEINTIEEAIDDSFEEMVTQEIEDEVVEIGEAIDNNIEQEIENTPANTTPSARKTAMKKRKKVMRTRVKSRKKVRKYRGRCPAF